MDDGPPPPPPPPHGENKGKRGGLPDGNYDIFIIPPHMSGGGFLYLPSLKPNWNSFIAGFASCTLLVLIMYLLTPIFQHWWNGVKGQNGIMLLFMLAIGAGAWAFGRAQAEGSRGGMPGSGAPPSDHGHSNGHASGGTHMPSGGAGPMPGAGGYPGSGPMPRGAPGADRPKPDNSWQSPPPRPQQHTGYERPRDPHSNSSWQSTPSPEPEVPPPRPQPHYAPPPRAQPQPAPPPPKPQSQPAPPPRAQPQPAPPPPKPQPQPAPPPRAQPQPAPPPPRAQPAPSPPRPQPQSAPPQPKPQPAPPPPKTAPTPKPPSTAWERSKEETKRREEERKAAEAAQKQKDENERRRKESIERMKQMRENERAELEARVAKEKRAKELQVAKEKREKLAAEKLAAEKLAAEKLAAEKLAAERGTSYAYSAVGEKTTLWPNGPPTAKPATSPSPLKPTARPSPASPPTKPAARPTPSPSPTKPTAKPSPSPSPTKQPTPKRPPFPTAYTAHETEEDAYSFRPYDKPRQPAYQRRHSQSSTISDSSYAASQSTSRTTPPASQHGKYTTDDPNKIIIKAVYAYDKQFLKAPTKQLVAGLGGHSDGLVLQITTERLMIDDDVSHEGLNEWDIRAWSLKTVELGEWKARGLHVMRVTTKDVERKTYVFVVGRDQSMKLVDGLAKLKGGAIAGKGLIIAAIKEKDAQATLEALGW